MIADLVLVAILVLAALLGMKAGLFDMLGRLLLLLLSLGLTLLLLGPVTGFLTRLPWLEPVGEWLAHPVVKTFEDTAVSIEEAIERFALPPLLEALMSSQMPEGVSGANQALPELTAALFRFALMAAVFVILFTLIAFLVHRLTRLMTRWSDSLPVIGSLNRLGGFLAGAVFGLIVINMLLLLSGLLAPYIPATATMIESSRLARYLYLANFLTELVRTS
jgi:uncharacterized membrane protein required for colicin V production